MPSFFRMVRRKNMVAAYPERRTPEMPKVFTTAVFGQFSALHPRHINGLAHGKNLKIAKTMGESAKIG